MYNINIIASYKEIGFEWDEGKAALNLAKHKVSFDEALTVFSDPYARIAFDVDHSDKEDRFRIIGMSMLRAQLLFVCYCERQCGGTIRIISARKATKRENKEYWRYCNGEGI